jgi:hypothetical protein
VTFQPMVASVSSAVAAWLEATHSGRSSGDPIVFCPMTVAGRRATLAADSAPRSTGMHATRRPSLKDRLLAAYWMIVGIVGLGRPIVDRRSMFGDDPKNDPYSIDYDPSRRR